MKKRFLLPYFIVLIPALIIVLTFFVYEIYNHGLADGLFLIFLTWSGYILCVPAAHGRFFISTPLRFVLRRTVFTEPYLWFGAIATNIAVLLLIPDVYKEIIPTYLLFHVLTNPSYWPILALGAVGAWYRTAVGHEAYHKRELWHTTVRHLLLIVGLAVLVYFLHIEFILLLNARADG